MRRIFLFYTISVLLLCSSGCVNYGMIRDIAHRDTVEEEEALQHMAVKPRFHTGKRLVYVMAWNGIPVGRIIAEAGDIIEYKGRDVHVVKVITESNKFLSKIYRVEDVYTSYIDVETMTSRRYEADRKEGNYRKHLIVEYDFDNLEAEYTNLTDGSVKRCSIKRDVQDPLSAMCYFMTLPVELGDKIHIIINLNEKNYQLYGEVEDLDVIRLRDLGEFPAFKLRPYAELKGKKVKKGNGWMYFSADENRYPLYGVVFIPFGRVTAKLVSIENI